MTDLTPILRQLRSLPPEELSVVRAKMGAWNKLGGNSEVTERAIMPTSDDDYLLEGIHFELRRRGLLGAEFRIPHRLYPTGYVQRSAEVRRLLESKLPRLKPVERTALGRLAARALADYLTNIHVTITPRVIMSHVGNTPIALDEAYPDYLAAGLLHFCW